MTVVWIGRGCAVLRHDMDCKLWIQVGMEAMSSMLAGFLWGVRWSQVLSVGGIRQGVIGVCNGIACGSCW